MRIACLGKPDSCLGIIYSCIAEIIQLYTPIQPETLLAQFAQYIQALLACLLYIQLVLAGMMLATLHS